MVNVIAVLIIVLIVGRAVAYLIKAKKSGVQCIGCAEGGCCSGKKDEQDKKEESSCCCCSQTGEDDKKQQ